MTGDLDIESSANPRIRALTLLHKRPERDAQRRFLIEGTREIGRALDAGLTLDEILSRPDLAGPEQDSVVRSAVSSDVAVTRLSPRAFAKLSRRQNPDGLIALAAMPAVGLDALGGPPDLVLVAVGIEKPGNLGAMLRTADATGATVVVADGTVDVFNPSVVRASQGALFSVPLAVAASPAALAWLKAGSAGLVTIGVTSPDAEQPFWELDLTGPAAVVVGSEHAGVTEPWLESGTPVRIPMAGRADSLNTSVAAAVMLYEATRQRRS